MIKKIGLFLLMITSSCVGGGVDLFNCVDDGVAEALADAEREWPSTAEVAARLDIMCVSREDIMSPSRCKAGGSLAKRIDTCTMGLGYDEFPGQRARMYVADDVSVAAAIRHESQHWHIWLDTELTDGCYNHRPACWDYNLPEMCSEDPECSE